MKPTGLMTRGGLVVVRVLAWDRAADVAMVLAHDPRRGNGSGYVALSLRPGELVTTEEVDVEGVLKLAKVVIDQNTRVVRGGSRERTPAFKKWKREHERKKYATDPEYRRRMIEAVIRSKRKKQAERDESELRASIVKLTEMVNEQRTDP